MNDWRTTNSTSFPRKSFTTSCLPHFTGLQSNPINGWWYFLLRFYEICVAIWNIFIYRLDISGDKSCSHYVQSTLYRNSLISIEHDKLHDEEIASVNNISAKRKWNKIPNLCFVIWCDVSLFSVLLNIAKYSLGGNTRHERVFTIKMISSTTEWE